MAPIIYGMDLSPSYEIHSDKLSKIFRVPEICTDSCLRHQLEFGFLLVQSLTTHSLRKEFTSKKRLPQAFIKVNAVGQQCVLAKSLRLREECVI